MNKSAIKPSPAKNTSTANNAGAPGTKENPLSREEYSALPKESRLIVALDGKKGAWWKAQDGPKFAPEGEGIRGRTEGSINNEGAGSGIKGGIKGAARLASLAAGNAVAIRLTGETEGDFEARKKSVTLGNLMTMAVAPHISVKLAAVAGGKVRRALSLAEKMEKMPMVPREILVTIEMHAEIEIPAQAAGEIILSNLSPLSTLAEGEESRVMSLLSKSPGSAFRAS